jgi:hypothetical protein
VERATDRRSKSDTDPSSSDRSDRDVAPTEGGWVGWVDMLTVVLREAPEVKVTPVQVEGTVDVEERADMDKSSAPVVDSVVAADATDRGGDPTSGRTDDTGEHDRDDDSDDSVSSACTSPTHTTGGGTAVDSSVARDGDGHGDVAGDGDVKGAEPRQPIGKTDSADDTLRPARTRMPSLQWLVKPRAACHEYGY